MNNKQMIIKRERISIRELTQGYKNNNEKGVWAYKGKLNIRPAFQREFVYEEEKQVAVIKTVRKKYPLNTMYWIENNGNYELLDGQQRTLSICQYVHNNLAVDGFYFHSLTNEEKKEILDYELFIYTCSGSKREKLKWFETINIGGMTLTKQELRNANYTGEWLLDAKKYFSRKKSPAYKKYRDYLKGDHTRQAYLETAIMWMIDSKKNDEIIKYMSKMQHQENAFQLWDNLKNILEWVKTIFPTYRKEMKGLNWGEMYKKYKNDSLDPKNLEKKIEDLYHDSEIDSRAGIFYYLLSGEERHLNLRSFNRKDKIICLKKQNYCCNKCKKKINFSEAQADHINPWSKGGKTTPDNLQILCYMCNAQKGNK